MNERNTSEEEFQLSTRCPAVIQLAQVLFEEMEHLDPGSCGAGIDVEVCWDALPPREKEYYALSVESILRRRALVLSVLSHDDMELRKSVVRE
jgi:hypothetical protein